MSQRNVEMVVGRLVTDEEFRRVFESNPQRLLTDLLERGVLLTPTEIAALTSMEAAFWKRVAAELDPRLQKASLRSK